MFFVETVNNTEYQIQPWTTRDEIAYNLYVGEETKVKDIFKLLIKISPAPDNFSEQDMVYILYQTYINSVGGDVSLQHTCPNCSTVNDSTIQIGDFLTYDKEEDVFEEDGYEIIVNGSNITIKYENRELSKTETDYYIDNEMSFLTAQKVDKVTSSSEVKIPAELMCISCKTVHIHHLDNMYKTDLSKTSIGNLYQMGTDFAHYGSIALSDYYNMLPFERDVFFSLIEKRREEDNKQ